ncbi:MAG: protein kinase [Polyangiaceae bacterium]|nr:protein kinase [Polyangiaceae bacterium]MCB9604958.1 protein kinase [Polyangiaceae bacterium]
MARQSVDYDRLGEYQLLERLGVGGMAEVYVATRSGPHGFVKRVALKCMLPELLQDTRFVEMFCDEARVMASLHHPNLVQVLDFGEVDGRLFMALEYVDGLSCAKLLRAVAAKGKRFPHGAALYIAGEVLSGLAYAHEHCDEQGRMLGLVHRDVSPGNILIGRTGEVKLTDFGILKSEVLDRRTLPGELKGKLGYMSPEQVIGGEVDARSDLFTLGIVLAEMLLARPLFPGRNELDVLSRIYDGDLGVLERHGSALPPVLHELLRRALARDPRDRFAGAREFREEVHAAMARLGLAPNDTVLLPWLHEARVLPNQSGTRPRVSADAARVPRPRLPNPEPLDPDRTPLEFDPLAPAPMAQPEAESAQIAPSGPRSAGPPESGPRPSFRPVAPSLPPRARRQQFGEREARLPPPPPPSSRRESARPTLPVGALARVRRELAASSEMTPPSSSAPRSQQQVSAALARSRTAPPPSGASRPRPPRPVSGAGPLRFNAASKSPELRLARPGELPVGPLSLPQLLGMAATGHIPRGSRVAFDGGAFSPVEAQPLLGRIVGRREYRLEPPHVAPTWSIEISGASLLPRLFEIAALRASGLVELKDSASLSPRIKHIYFKQGRAVCVLGNAQRELLGARLVAQGDIRPEILEQALVRSAQSGRRLGEELVLMNAVRPPILLRAVSLQVEERLLDGVRWRSGHAAFYAGTPLSPDLVGQAPDESVWLRVVRECFSLQEIQGLLAPWLDCAVERSHHAGAEQLLRQTHAPEALVLEFTDAASTLRQLFQSLAQDGVARGEEAVRSVFLGLVSGWLRLAGQRAFEL